jgi:hypothetical protein
MLTTRMLISLIQLTLPAVEFLTVCVLLILLLARREMRSQYNTPVSARVHTLTSKYDYVLLKLICMYQESSLVSLAIIHPVILN